jgi:fluoroacetyl-CoA thioesterase
VSVSDWLRKGTVSTTIGARVAASAFSKPEKSPSGTEARARRTASSARERSREPMTTGTPARPHRSARPKPRAPDAPMMETGGGTGGEYMVRPDASGRTHDLAAVAVTDVREEEFTAEGDLLTDVGGTLPRKVLSTPGMISMMEWASARLAREHLGDGCTTVGFEVCVKHVGAALEGARCTVRSQLREIVDGRKLRFDVEVREGERLVGTGTHERRAIEP